MMRRATSFLSQNLGYSVPDLVTGGTYSKPPSPSRLSAEPDLFLTLVQAGFCDLFLLRLRLDDSAAGRAVKLLGIMTS